MRAAANVCYVACEALACMHIAGPVLERSYTCSNANHMLWREYCLEHYPLCV